MKTSPRAIPASPRSSARRVVRSGAWYLALCALLACSYRNPEFSSLHDAGIIPVSRDNSYIGSNLYLAHEMEDSAYLYNFVKETGAPQAIEIVGGSEDTAELRLFYSGRNQVYRATPIIQGSPPQTEWVIRGPYTIDREQYRAVSQLSSQPGAQFEMWGRRELVGSQEVIAEQRVILPAFVPTPKPRVHRRPSKAASESGTGPAIGGPAGSGTAMTLDQIAIMESKDLAERAPNGDVIHVVKSSTETITTISNWYAGSGEHASKIAEKNNLPLDAKLQPGTRVFVQSELVVNKKSMK